MMKSNDSGPNNAMELRKQAEEIALRKAGPSSPDQLASLSLEEIQQTLHELRVHQIELELQNEELRRAQLELEISRRRYFDLYDLAPVGYLLLNEWWQILEVNLAAATLLGVERSQIIMKPLSSFVFHEDQDDYYLNCIQLKERDSLPACEMRMTPKKGDPLWVQLEIAAVKNDGDGRFYRAMVSNIHQRKLAQQKQMISETTYRCLFETATVGIFILAADTGEIADANPHILEMLGYARQDVLGKKLREVVVFKAIEGLKDFFSALLNQERNHFDNLLLETKDGKQVYVEWVSNAYQVDCQKVIQCSIRNISKQMQLSMALEKANHELEKRVEERTAKLEEALSEIKLMKDQLEIENIYFRREIKVKQHFGQILGSSDGLKYVLYRAEQVAASKTTVLILGETGSGKELIASAIHNMSPRQERPLITVNCAALPSNLIESELFGREKGAYTGADSRQVGRFEVAHGSTLCLDEIGELPLEIQAKLLRVIQHNEFERLGSPHTIKVDVRIIATTNRSLEEEMRQGRFRQDLYYRLNVYPITVPPLRQRKDDIPVLVEAFVERYSRKLGKRITSIPKETMKALQDYSWPGNIRELESIIERAVILCPKPVLQLADKLELPSFSVSSAMRTLEATDRDHILKTLLETRWRIEGKNGAAAILGLHPSTLRARMHKLGIIRPQLK